MPLVSAFLVWTFSLYTKFKTIQYLRGICPQQKMSSIGKFRRNFTTFEQTMQFIHIYFFYGVVRGISLCLFQAFSFEPQTNFLLANILDYLYMDVYHGIFLPLIMKIPPTLSTNRQRHPTGFFVRRPTFLEPRRPVQSKEENSTRGSAALCWAAESMQTNKGRRRRQKVSCARSSSREDLERLSRGKKSIGEMDSPTRNFTRKLQNGSNKDVNKTRKGFSSSSSSFSSSSSPAITRSRAIEVQVHGSMPQDCDHIENSYFRSTRSDSIVHIDI